MSKNDAKKKATDRWGLSTVGGNARMARKLALLSLPVPKSLIAWKFDRKCSVSTNTPPVRPTYMFISLFSRFLHHISYMQYGHYGFRVTEMHHAGSIIHTIYR